MPLRLRPVRLGFGRNSLEGRGPAKAFPILPEVRPQHVAHRVPQKCRMKIFPAKTTDEQAIKQLLADCDLPLGDLTSDHLRHFFVSRDGERLIGAAGLELCHEAALLRSVAVAGEFRSQGLGRQLVARAEEHARSHGVNSLWLLTTGVEHFFTRLGYEVTDRALAPKAIQITTEFTSLCPSSSVCMVKRRI